MSGAIIYKGPSQLDRHPIVAIAIMGSKNVKTGGMVQTYIMRSDIDPLLANKLGEDKSICGDCRHRGTPTLDPDRKLAEGRSCYVNMGQGPLSVWKQFLAGKYADACSTLGRNGVGENRQVRIGTYGDGAAVPRYVWKDMLFKARGHTAYTHNGGSPSTYMVSADSLEEAQAAWEGNARTFRILGPGDSPVPGKETLCPASKEAGYKATCETCMLCAGTSVKARSIAIYAHGTGKRFFEAA